jgi:hypothetical protein
MYTVKDPHGVWHLVEFVHDDRQVRCSRFRGQQAVDVLNTRLRVRAAYPPTCFECIQSER